MSLAAATPVIVNQDAGHYMQLFGADQYAIDRSDQQVASTSGNGGDYGGGYGGSYGGGYGGGYGGSDLGDGHGGGSFDSVGSAGGHIESSGGFEGGHQDYSSGFDSGHGGGFDAGHGGDDGGHGISLDGGHNYVHSVPVSEHVEVTKPVAVPVYKHIGNVLLHSFLRAVLENHRIKSYNAIRKSSLY